GRESTLPTCSRRRRTREFGARVGGRSGFWGICGCVAKTRDATARCRWPVPFLLCSYPQLASKAKLRRRLAPPTVANVNPNTGPTSGGTSVTITGTNFSGATAVSFGSNAAGSFTVNSATQITATSPAGVGTVDVTVTTEGGTSAISSGDRFTYGSAPTVTNVNPNTGPTSGGASVTITGTNFSGATAVRFGNNAAGPFTADSATQITATSPTGVGTISEQ